MLKKKKGKRRIIVNINVRLLYSENNIWSQRYKQWNRYQVRKPRLPNEMYKTTRLVEHPDNVPKSFNAFVGKHNTGIFMSLKEVLEKFEKIKLFPDVLTIHGPSGSGKSAIGKVFMNDLVDMMKFKQAGQAEKWCLFMDAKQYRKDLSTFWSRVTTFAEPPLEKALATKYRLLVVDNFDSIPPSSQQILKRIMEAYSSTLKYIFICPDPKACMTNFVLTKSTSFKTRAINERDALQVVLAICNQHRIGFEREGIKTVFSLHPNRSLSNMIDLIEEVFLKRYFVSRENVLRVAVGKASDVNDLPVLAQHRAVEPFERCKACTLVPPCQHISLEDLVKLGSARRKELPRYKDGSMACPEFVRYGYCSMFNRNGHCSLDHPKNLHVIKKFAMRCPQCSITWPCNHCDFTKQRRSMQDLIDELQARIGRIRAINVPEPPVSLTRHLVRRLFNALWGWPFALELYS
jgi:DNA replication protein DnaC